MSRQGWLNMTEAVLLGILVHGERYGRDIAREYEGRTGRAIPVGSLYVTLDRMEGQGLISSRMGDRTRDLGGNRRQYFRIRAAGHRAFDRAYFEMARRSEVKGGRA